MPTTTVTTTNTSAGGTTTQTQTITTPELAAAAAAGNPAAAPEVKCNFNIVCVGAGYSGLYLLHKAHTEGFSIKCIEAGDEVGGTWCVSAAAANFFCARSRRSRSSYTQACGHTALTVSASPRPLPGSETATPAPSAMSSRHSTRTPSGPPGAVQRT